MHAQLDMFRSEWHLNLKFLTHLLDTEVSDEVNSVNNIG